MNSRQQIYIALGSNKGDRFKHLQDAVEFIHLKLGAIKIISKVYSTPALGFEADNPGDDFLNACLLVDTELKPKKVMQEFWSAVLAREWQLQQISINISEQLSVIIKRVLFCLDNIIMQTLFA